MNRRTLLRAGAAAGGETGVEIEVVADVAVQDGDGDVLVKATTSDTATVTVTRKAGGEASVGGDGSLSVKI